MTSAIPRFFQRARPLLLAAGVLLAPDLSWGAALDPASCAKLKTEQETMERSGLKEAVSRGPEWAKANLSAEKLNEIKRLIEVDEQLLFRCPGRHLVNLPLEPDPPPPPQADDKKGEADKADSPAAVPKPSPAPADKKAAEKKAPEKKAAPPPQQQQQPRKTPTAKANAAAEAGDGAEPKAEQKAAPKVKATAKPKPRDDAYKPPAGDPNNPFGVN